MIMRATWPAKLTRLGLAAVLAVGGLGLAFGPAVAQDRKDPERKDGEPRKERFGGDERKDRPAPPREVERGRDRPPEAGDREAIERARAALERARRVAEEAMTQVRAAEEALARAEGRPVPPRGDRDRGERLDGDRRPDVPPAPPAVRPGVPVPPPPAVRPGVPATPPPPAPPAFPRRPGAEGNELRDLQMQMEELRRALEQMRQELRRERGDRKDGEPKRDRPREEPKRPVREPDRADFGR